ncbi:dipeptidyl aminopeptidase/acylaminoacyl peptidase [Streptosporangium becharense]|uniref:Dipeptidyl aminopeptidase/acylaminoacyl peptidase n=1 Tax=Streptosporangium becharense TaxID=1816182 RepID=A0A7W9MJQ3_9ACTN|nr:S9 family peptidase [Streptosporangium becharense]MBB2911463.1 dipeptidyl aminopeptidase/acylaminoacyl peptidase [Streptosporangium becharense]MBB5822719.1 dipeptidyl aminopeptidase/acylaminoacyl peptidase [Streptosporangium becharense]
MRAEDLASLHVPGTVTLHDGLLLVDVARPDLETDSYRGNLWRFSPDGPPVPFTFGDHDTAPRISPDGAWVAFLRTQDDDRPQLHVMPTGGGEARPVTDLPLGAGTPVWAPDSRRIAFVARVAEPGRYGTDEGVDAAAEAPRRITGLRYRLDGVGFTFDRRPALFVVNALAEAPQPVRLTEGAYDVDSPAWTPDGRHVLVSASRDLDGESLHTDVYAVPADGGSPVLVVRSGGTAEYPVPLPGGELLYLGTEFSGIDAVARNAGLFRAPLRIGGEAATGVRLTEEESVGCEALPPVPIKDGVLVAVRVRGAIELRLVPAGSPGAPLEKLVLVLGERASVKAFAAHGEQIVAVVSTPRSPGEVVTPAGPLPGFPGPPAGLGSLEEITAVSPDGYPVHGWLALPEGTGPHPVLLNVHGGPFHHHGWGFLDENHVYAGAGYAVVLPNPRGSAGYGQEHGRSVVGALGTVDADDVLALLDAALARPECDARRVGVMGGSYGGFMTSWLAAHHGDRFRAAWSERAVNAWDSFTGSSDIGWYFTEAYCGPDAETQRAMSPLYHAGRITLPFAVVHSEEDWRCPVEQAQRMFVALRRNGTPAEFLLFPGEGHELTRSGRPRHRVQRFEAVLEWWSRHLS